MVRRVPDITLAHELPGFRPYYSLDDIIGEVIRHFGGAHPHCFLEKTGCGDSKTIPKGRIKRSSRF